MNKTKVIGLTITVLAVIGGVAVYNYARKPRKNSDGFFNADGTRSGGCRVCEGGLSNYFAPNGNCRRGDSCVQTTLQYKALQGA
jgi:hypothetical protein